MTQCVRFACCINDQLLFRCLSFSLFAGDFHASLLQKVDSQETSGHKSRTLSCAASAAACIRRPQVTQSDGVTSQWQPSQLSRRMARSTSSSTTSYDSSGGPAQQPQLKRWTEHHPSMNHRSSASSAVSGTLLSSGDSPGSRVAHRSAAGWCTGCTLLSSRLSSRAPLLLSIQPA